MRNVTGHFTASTLASIKCGAFNQSPVRGLTHCFYKYPARFSPSFVASAIEAFSAPGDTILDPYMGGGTTIVEAISRGRHAIGCDLNSLAVFVAKAKTTNLADHDIQQVMRWAERDIPKLSYHTVTDEVANLVCPQRTRNLNLPRARPVKKLIALAILSLKTLSSSPAQDFARCVLLNVAQWALNNRKVAPTLVSVRRKISATTVQMLGGISDLARISSEFEASNHEPILIHGTATDLPLYAPFINGHKANLVVTSPPYPGIHILYHRWQVDGRKETPAPYWIANCYDGKSSAFYNFADRKADAIDDYFDESLRTLRSIRSVMVDGGVIAQLIAFSKPRSQLRKYLQNMKLAGFTEVREIDDGITSTQFRRIWRPVPSRAWYANLKGDTHSSREVVLLHRAN